MHFLKKICFLVYQLLLLFYGLNPQLYLIFFVFALLNLDFDQNINFLDIENNSSIITDTRQIKDQYNKAFNIDIDNPNHSGKIVDLPNAKKI